MRAQDAEMVADSTPGRVSKESAEARSIMAHVIRECDECAIAPSQQPAWRLRSALTESARLIRQLRDDLPIG